MKMSEYRVIIMSKNICDRFPSRFIVALALKLKTSYNLKVQILNLKEEEEKRVD